MRSKQSGFAIHVVALVAMAISIVVFTGWYVWHARQNANRAYDSADKVSQGQAVRKTTSGSAKSTKSSSKSVDASTSSSYQAAATDTAQPSRAKSTTKTFNFVNTDNWVEQASSDGVYTVLLGQGFSYGHCNDVNSSITIGMVYMDYLGQGFDCGGMKGAVSWRDTKYGNMLLTRNMIGESESLWDRHDTEPVEVTLLNGQKASRYQYSNAIDGKIYITIEYVTTYKGKGYTALMHWENGTDVTSGSNITIDTFDTIVQKTWKFKD